MHVLRMLRTGGMFGVHHAPFSDAGVGGDTQMTGDAGADAPETGDPSGGDDDAGADAGDRRDATDDDERDLIGDDDDDQASQLSDREQVQRLRKANRRLKSRYLKAKPVVDRFKGQDIDTLILKARRFDELQQNPRALIHGGDADDREPTRASTKPAALPPLPTQFTAEALGFDPDDSPANRVIANAIQTIAHLQTQVAELSAMAPTVKNLDRTFSQNKAATETREWQTAIATLETEIKKVAPNNKFLLRVAKDALVGAYNTRGQHRQSPQAIVKAYMQDLVAGGQLTPKQAGQVSAATQSRMANHNRTLPRSPAGGGQPSGARGSQRPTLKDVHKRLRAGEIGPR